jgi:HEAT repeat protein
MRQLFSSKSLLGLVLFLAVAGLAWWGWKPALIWYCVHGLAGAEEKARDKWLRRLDWLDSAVVPALLDCLGRDDARACANVEAALVHLTHAWGLADGRCRELLDEARQRFAAFSAAGREAILHWQIALLHDADSKAPVPAALRQRACDLLVQAADRDEAGVRGQALALAGVLLERTGPGPWLDRCRELLRKGFADHDADTRLRAVQLSLQTCFQTDTILLKQVVPLLHDPSPAVRRVALLSIGPLPAVVSEEDLMPLLHDADADVRRWCETALRSRGLQDEQVLLARLASDSRASARLEVLYHLGRAEVDAGLWLRRLSQDPSPAVRAAAIRAAAQADIALGDRLRQMAQSDPSPTVRQLAAFYQQR